MNLCSDDSSGAEGDFAFRDIASALAEGGSSIIICLLTLLCCGSAVEFGSACTVIGSKIKRKDIIPKELLIVMSMNRFLTFNSLSLSL